MTTLFALDFDDEEAGQAATPAPVKIAVESAGEQLVTLSPEKLEALLDKARHEARDEAFLAGVAAAKTEMESAIATHAASTLDSITEALQALATQDDIRRRELERDVVELFLDVGEKIIPQLLSAYSTDLAVEQIRKSLRMTDGTTRLSIRVSPNTQVAVAAELEALTLKNNLSLQPQLTADPSMKDGEARLDWENGFMEYSLDLVCNQLLDALHTAAQQMNDNHRKTG